MRMAGKEGCISEIVSKCALRCFPHLKLARPDAFDDDQVSFGNDLLLEESPDSTSFSEDCFTLIDVGLDSLSSNLHSDRHGASLLVAAAEAVVGKQAEGAA